jgi:hypothetical protein
MKVQTPVREQGSSKEGPVKTLGEAEAQAVVLNYYAPYDSDDARFVGVFQDLCPREPIKGKLVS